MSGASYKAILFVVLGTLLASGCAKKSADKMSPPRKAELIVEKVDGLEIEFRPKVNILFVKDNSESMQDELERVAEGIDKFLSEFAGKGVIEWRIGVISVYDSRRASFISEAGLGRLERLKSIDQSGNVIVLDPIFATKENSTKEIIAATINSGVKSLKDGGPEFEEMFTPLLAATDPTLNAESNGGFWQRDAHKVIVMLSDENDSSPSLSVEDFTQRFHANMRALSDSHANYSIYAIVALQNYLDNSGGIKSCKLNSYALPPTRIVDAVALLGGQSFPICESSFGATLAEIGSDIKKKVLPKEFRIVGGVPEADTLKLLYNGEEIAASRGWAYNPDTGMVRIEPTVDIESVPGGKFEIRSTKISDRAVRQGKVIKEIF
ncbi:MAG: hypothetical protein COT74_14240 [Bdellovibrionales bacterium CG10_big_fil_rev_8_21_14_0_10_45_34]|nr:MAG: hypothetical protein COT74_14240 [Bdellovibrionales bacterium CG10_big_fil_rev_8_21_14_0_10_45_34]